MRFLPVVIILLASCNDEGIKVYNVEKQHREVSFKEGNAGTGIIAAVINLPSKQWYIKLTGPLEGLKEELEPFKKMVKGITFDTNSNPTIKTGEGWTELKGHSMRYATYKKNDLEISVVSLPHSPLLDNINRWRSQVGLSPVEDEREAMESVDIIEVSGYKAAIVVLIP